MCICNPVYTTMYNTIYTNMYNIYIYIYIYVNIYIPTYNDKQKYLGETSKIFKRLKN